MEKVQISWGPVGFKPSALGATRTSGVPTNGDTPYVHTAICMLGIATPEIHYPGNTNPSNHHRRFQVSAGWMQQGLAFVNDGIAACSMPKVGTGSARHFKQSRFKLLKAKNRFGLLRINCRSMNDI